MNDRGSVAIEFACIAPLLLLICGFVIDGGFGLQAKQAVMFGTQQAAVAAAGGSSAWSDVFNASMVSYADSPAVQCSQSGQTWTCTGTANYLALFGGLGIPTSWPITYSATAAIPQAPSAPQ